MTRILVVDDEKPVRGLLKSSLEREGYEVICASPGEAALEELQKKPALALPDIITPDIHGLQVLLCSLAQKPAFRVGSQY